MTAYINTAHAIPTAVEEKKHLPISKAEEKDRFSTEGNPTDSLGLDAAEGDIKELHIVNSESYISYNIVDALGNHLYHLHSSHLTPGTPDMTLFDGTNKNAPVLAASRIHWLKQTVDIALGDPSQVYSSSSDNNNEKWSSLASGGTKYSVMRKKGFFTTQNSWLMPGEEDSSKAYIWKRTHATPMLPGLDKVPMSKISADHMKLVQASTGRTVACFIHGFFKLQSFGSFFIDQQEAPPGQAQDWILMVLMTGMAVREKRKRERMYSAAGSGGGS